MSKSWKGDGVTINTCPRTRKTEKYTPVKKRMCIVERNIVLLKPLKKKTWGGISNSDVCLNSFKKFLNNHSNSKIIKFFYFLQIEFRTWRTIVKKWIIFRFISPVECNV